MSDLCYLRKPRMNRCDWCELICLSKHVVLVNTDFFVWLTEVKTSMYPGKCTHKRKSQHYPSQNVQDIIDLDLVFFILAINTNQPHIFTWTACHFLPGTSFSITNNDHRGLIILQNTRNNSQMRWLQRRSIELFVNISFL